MYGISAAVSGTPAPITETPRGAWYALAVVTLVYALNIADRFVLSTLIEPIKAEFALSDAAIGFLTGTALAIFYVTAGIPLGILADRVNRRNLIAGSLAVWSLMTMVCGLAQNFWQLLLARIGVGVGEAGGTPSSQSLLADKFPERRRALVMSIFAVGASIGGLLGSSVGGWLAQEHGWRTVLLVFGLAGLPVALLVLLTLAEPRRGALDAPAAMVPAPTFRDTLRFIAADRALLHLLLGAMIVTFWGWGLIWWTPAFLSRSHGLTVGEAGALLGPMHGIGGTLATLATAWAMGTRLGRDSRHQLWFLVVTTVAGLIPAILVYSANDLATAHWALWIFLPITYINLGPTLALLQNLVPPTMRAQVCAVLLFVANLANLALAPQLIGLASDWVAAGPVPGAESLRYVLLGVTLTGIWGAWHYYAAIRHLKPAST
jgi:MFS family permease